MTVLARCGLPCHHAPTCAGHHVHIHHRRDVARVDSEGQEAAPHRPAPVGSHQHLNRHGGPAPSAHGLHPGAGLDHHLGQRVRLGAGLPSRGDSFWIRLPGERAPHRVFHYTVQYMCRVHCTLCIAGVHQSWTVVAPPLALSTPTPVARLLPAAKFECGGMCCWVVQVVQGSLPRLFTNPYKYHGPTYRYPDHLPQLIYVLYMVCAGLRHQ